MTRKTIIINPKLKYPRGIIQMTLKRPDTWKPYVYPKKRPKVWAARKRNIA